MAISPDDGFLYGIDDRCELRVFQITVDSSWGQEVESDWSEIVSRKQDRVRFGQFNCM